MNCNHTKRRYLILLVAITVLMIFLYNNCFPTITTINIIHGAKILFNHKKLMEQRLKTKKLTFEKYGDYRIVYDDILELEKLQSFNFDLRDIHRNVISKLYEVYGGSSSNIKKNLTPKQRFVMEQKEMICDALKIIGSKLGTFIDAHDLVVRLNHAPTQGFEVDVGSKTDLRIVNTDLDISLAEKKPSIECPQPRSEITDLSPFQPERDLLSSKNSIPPIESEPSVLTHSEEEGLFRRSRSSDSENTTSSTAKQTVAKQNKTEVDDTVKPHIAVTKTCLLQKRSWQS
ncbi:unnamed protein product [Lepeophtheirus salmonis]|uniref:beta-galactoside alpha-(2,6)-sialyltransferase n=1 Tax=Lepeophtheirus salmonis TaxID=72036 RepID=A0A7R8D3E4_LEPSM|nr:unnamed protein product [Lepeophtheirus salmonis]CAF2982562.1 unnamed protein product [Lepeophtheirus salmonis]